MINVDNGFIANGSQDLVNGDMLNTFNNDASSSINLTAQTVNYESKFFVKYDVIRVGGVNSLSFQGTTDVSLRNIDGGVEELDLINKEQLNFFEQRYTSEDYIRNYINELGAVGKKLYLA